MSLDQLKKIREQRVTRIQTQLKNLKEALLDAKHNLSKAKTTAYEFHLWRKRHETELFEQLQEQYFSPKQLEEYNQTLLTLKQKEQDLRERIPTFEEKLKKAKYSVERCKSQLQQANKEKEKVHEFISIKENKEIKIEEKQEENSMDEMNNQRQQ